MPQDDSVTAGNLYPPFFITPSEFCHSFLSPPCIKNIGRLPDLQRATGSESLASEGCKASLIENEELRDL